MSLRWRFLIFSAGCILAILALLSFFGISAARESTKQTLAERLLLAEQVAYNVDFNIEQAFNRLGAINATDITEIGQGGAASTDFLREVKTLLPFGTHYLYLVDGQGAVITSEPPIPELIGTDLSQNGYIKAVLESDRPMVSNVIFDGYVSNYVTYFLAPLADPVSKNPNMVISAAIDLSSSSIGHFINVNEVGKTGYTEIVDGGGMVLATNNPENFLKESDHGGVFADLIRDKKTAVSTCHNCHDESANKSFIREIITFAPLSTSSWGVVVRQSEEEALANTRLLTQRLIIFGLIFLAIILPVIWLATRSITVPINKLTIASRKIAQGSLDEAVSIPGKNEISVLAQSFDIMRTKLKDSIESLQQRTKELEGLNAIALTACQSLDLDNILADALKRVTDIVKMEIGGILLLDENSGDLSYRISQGMSGKNNQDSRLKLDASIEGEVARTAKPVIIGDVLKEKTATYPITIEEGVRAFVCFPLSTKDKIIGVINLASRKEKTFTPEDKQLMFSIASQISIAIENARLYEQVRDKEIILTELLKNSISAQEDERKRIARELHDETSQALTTLAIGLETIVKSPPADAERLKAAMRKNQDLTIKILEDVHRLILDLRPSVLDDLGLIPALEWYAKNRLDPEGVKVNVETSGSEKRPPPHVEVALFRMAQEAISNIAQHAQAKFASISLDFESNSIKLTVEDDGISFNTADVLSRVNGRRGLGLLGIKERAELLGGRINISSQPDTGTQISIEIPATWKGESVG